MPRTPLPRGSKLPVHFTTEECNLIREHTFYDPNFGNLALADNDGMRLEMTLDDIEDLQGYVAAESNHCDDPKLEKKLDAIFDKLQQFLDVHEEKDD